MTLHQNTNNSIQQYNDTFNEALIQLNPNQLKAVKQIDGAVLVVAGPGTGKTQLLAARIGYILRETDATPSNILCLTFTDAGAIAMRQRLLQFIGPEAYNVSIFTFHAFCNKVITENIEFFGGYYNMQAASDLEIEEILVKIIDSFPTDHPLRRFKGNIYYDKKRMKDLFNIMKQEGWTLKKINSEVESYLEILKEDPDMRYKVNGKNYKKGDLKKGEFDKKKKKLDELLAAAKEFDTYNALLEEAERFDFNDMILWVIERFKEIPDLLLQYQERYQYFLVDEYQDTNGAQNELLSLLAGYWENPNLFVVGDDDQSIFRFQGASMENIVHFKEQYSPELIVLENNYRSSQEILDYATKLIENNEGRLASKYREEITKNLVESRHKKETAAFPGTKILVYPNETQEELGIAQEIIELWEQGSDLSEIAVIYRNHANVENIVKYLELKGVPLNIRKRIDTLKTKEILNILNILRYIESEGKKIDHALDLLFEILHYEYFGISPRDVGLISVECAKTRNTDQWHKMLTSESMLSEIGVQGVEQVMNTYQLLQSWIKENKNVTLQVLLEIILTEGNIIQSIMKSADKVWRMQLVNTFFDLIKEESIKNPKVGISDLLRTIDLMDNSGIPLPFEKIISNNKGVNFITAHSSKGLEFKRVYLIRCERTNWEDKKSWTNFIFPETLVPSSRETNHEDERRLFYVALTRAKDYLQISFPAMKDTEKPLEPSKFLPEIMHIGEFENRSVDDESIMAYKAALMRYEQGTPVLIDHSLIDRSLENFSMSVTNLNKYLACPLRFYFESILKVPMARNANMGFGRAMHKALELTFKQIQNKKFPFVEEIHQYFEIGMEETKSHYTSREFEDLTIYGKKCLEAYYMQNHSKWSADYEYHLEYKISNVAFRNIPITGVLDKMVIMNDFLEVTDYKTGKIENARDKLKPFTGDDNPGGDYWRQIVFYKMLLEADPRVNKPMKFGKMDFLEPDKDDKLHFKSFEVEDFEVEIVADQLSTSYEKIMNHEFAKGCEKPECKWCNFVKHNFELQLNEEDLE